MDPIGANYGYDCLSRQEIPCLKSTKPPCLNYLHGFNQYSLDTFDGEPHRLPSDPPFDNHMLHEAGLPNACDDSLASSQWWLQSGIDKSQPSDFIVAPAEMSFADVAPKMASPDIQLDVEQLNCDLERDRSLPWVSELQQIQNKSYNCSEAPCNNIQLANKAGLKRHMREVHGSELHYCPIPTCDRHTNGFARRWNLTQHKKRRHRQRHKSPKYLPQNPKHAKSSSPLTSGPSYDVDHDLDHASSSSSESTYGSEADVRTEPLPVGGDGGTNEHGQADVQGKYAKEIQHFKRLRQNSIRDFDMMISALERVQRMADEAE